MRNLTLTLIGIILIVLPCAMATDYYYSNSGNDANDCSTPALACKTIVDLNGKAINDGDTIYFECGSVWLSPQDAFIVLSSGGAGNVVTYTSYGTCYDYNKPKFYGSFNASNTGNWTSLGSNMYSSAFTSALEIGSLLMNNVTVSGSIQSTLAAVNTQGEFFYNSTDDKVYVYSTSNPATYYSEVLVGIEDNIVDTNSISYVDIIGLEISYGARHGIEGANMAHINIFNNTLKMIGGAYQSGTTRYGNAIQTWDAASYVNISHNYIVNPYDTGISPQSTTASKDINHIYMTYNVIDRAYYCIEYFNRGAGSVASEIIIDHNTCYNTTGTNLLRTGSLYAQCFRTGAIDDEPNNLTFTNNICYQPSTAYKYFEMTSVTGVFDFDYNIYYNDSGTSWTWNTSYTQLQFATYKAATGQDAHSLLGDPYLNATDYVPNNGTTTCTMSSTGSYVGALPCYEPAAPEEPAEPIYYTPRISLAGFALRLAGGTLRI